MNRANNTQTLAPFELDRLTNLWMTRQKTKRNQSKSKRSDNNEREKTKVIILTNQRIDILVSQPVGHYQMIHGLCFQFTGRTRRHFFQLNEVSLKRESERKEWEKQRLENLMRSSKVMSVVLPAFNLHCIELAYQGMASV